MNADQERVLRAWLVARDPGDAPDRLRAAVADVPFAERPPMFLVVEEVRARFRWATMPVRLGVLAILLLAITVAIAAAALLLRNPFRPDGLIAYKSPGGMGGIRVVAADGSGDRALTLGDHDKSPRWSPDGKSLLFIRFVDGPPGLACPEQTSIVIYDVALGSERVLATAATVIKAEWSPSGSMIAFTGLGQHCEFTGSGLIDVASGRVTTSDAGTGAAWFFWTGDAITFFYPDHLSRFDPAASSGQTAEALVFKFEVGQQAMPSPDGRYVTVSSKPDANRKGALEIVDLTDGSRTDLGPGFFGVWSPDGSSVAFVQPGVPHTQQNLWRDRLVVTVGIERRLRTIADVVGGVAPIPDLAWTSDGQAIYWRNFTGAHAVEVSTGRSIDLPRVLVASDIVQNIQWQPRP